MSGKKKIIEGGFLTKDICGVYLIISPSGRKYVGSSINIRERWGFYRRGEKNKNLINNSIKKYGYENHIFKVLYQCSPEDRLIWERIFGDLYLTLSDFGGLNHNLPASDELPIIISKEVRKRLSLARLIPDRKLAAKIRQEKLNIWKRKDRAKKRELAGPVDRTIPTEQRERMKVASAIYHASDEGRRRNREAANKRFENQEERDRISKGLKKYYEDPNTRMALKERAAKMFSNPATHPRSKKVININTNEIFSCAILAAHAIGMSPRKLRYRLRGEVENDTPLRYAA